MRRGTSIGIGDALGRLLRRLDRKDGGGYSTARVSAAWERIAGDVMREHTTGTHLRDGTLVVYVDGPVWANELQAMSESYRQALNTEMGEELVRSVRFTVSRKVAQERALLVAEQAHEDFYRADHVEPVPLDELETEQARTAASSIEDPELREALMRAMVKDREWKKGLSDRNAAQGARERF